MYKAPRGTADILPEEQPYWRFVEEKVVALAQLYGYQRIDTPLFEDFSLFQRSVGEGTDIVEKEMYSFPDRGGGMLALRPEGTAPVCRAYAEHGMHSLPQPVRLYYWGPAFRYERPQAGRYRQHYQAGFEALGDADPALDAEVIEMAFQLFTSLGVKALSLHLNGIGCPSCRPGYVDKLREYYAPLKGSLCPDCQRRLLQNPLRLLDCKRDTCQPLAEAAPGSLDYLCADCLGHFRQLERYLSLLSLPYQLDHRLVRGLEYYTRTVFEVQPREEGGQSALAGGGRYDGLVQELGGRPTPGVGFAIGIERAIRQLKSQGIPVLPLPHPKAFLAYAGEDAREQAFLLTVRLRQKGVGALLAAGGRSLKGQLKQAHALGIKKVLILGEVEVREGKVTLRDMDTGQQEILPLAEAEERLKEI